MARAAIVKHHVGMIPLPPADDVACEESGSLRLGNREGLRGLAGLRDVPLRMETTLEPGSCLGAIKVNLGELHLRSNSFAQLLGVGDV